MNIKGIEVGYSKRDKYLIAWARGLAFRMTNLRPILIKRKSAFTIYEWMKIKEVLNIIDD